MGQQVAVQVILTLECFVTDVAKVLSFVTVGETMFGKSGGISEHLIAQVALLGASLRFVPVVRRWRGESEQQPWSWRLLAACWTRRVEKRVGIRYGIGRERIRGVEGGGGGDGNLRRFVRLGAAIEEDVIDLVELAVDGGLGPGGDVHGGGDGAGVRVADCVQSDEVSLVAVFRLETFQDLTQRNMFG